MGRNGQLYVNPVAAGAVIGAVAATMMYEQNVVYPRYETSYTYEPRTQLYIFVDGYGRRHYMPHGWNYREHGVPGHEGRH